MYLSLHQSCEGRVYILCLIKMWSSNWTFLCFYLAFQGQESWFAFTLIQDLVRKETPHEMGWHLMVTANCEADHEKAWRKTKMARLPQSTRDVLHHLRTHVVFHSHYMYSQILGGATRLSRRYMKLSICGPGKPTCCSFMTPRANVDCATT